MQSASIYSNMKLSIIVVSLIPITRVLMSFNPQLQLKARLYALR